MRHSSGHRRWSEEKICTTTGEVAFGIGLDAMMANGAGAAKTAVQYAQKLRTALSVSEKVRLPASCRM